MSDGATIVLPEQRRTIDQNEAGPALARGRIVSPLPSRPPEIPDFTTDNPDAPLIVLDLGDTAIAVTDDIGAPAVHGTRTQDEDADFGRNLALDTTDGTLARIASEIMEGVESDEQSRQPWIEQYTRGLDLLGLKIEEPADGQRQTGSRRQGVSRANDPLLIEAIVKYAASADGELLPAAGPAKVETIGQEETDQEQLARDFADDLNYFLTEVATEYYPDTSSMLVHQGYCGMGFKKTYRCPIRRRPVSESLYAPDLIVSEEATDLDSALRVTHSIQMLRGQLKRMQLVGQYRNVDLGQPTGQLSIGRQAQRAINTLQGLTPTANRPQDAPYEILETDYELDPEFDIPGPYERRAPDGLSLPYKITFERNTRQVLAIWRNWRPGDDLYLKRNVYTKYGMMPGLGFHSWGFLQLLGNQTRALRSCLRILIDAGMFANFPGGLKAGKTRTATNEYAPAPGEWLDVDMTAAGPNFDIRKYFMPMPYTPPNPVFVQIMELVKQDAMRLAGTVMLEVGEGRTNMPVGSILAMIEQQMQVMAAVHKRNHRAQKQELRNIRELFADNPEDLSRLCRDRPRPGDREQRIWRKAEEFMSLNLVPATDPNVPSRVHSIMLANVLVMLAEKFPQLMDQSAALRDAVQTIGKSPDNYVRRPEQMGTPQPDPLVTAATITAQSRAASDLAKQETERQAQIIGAQKDAADNATKIEVAEITATRGSTAQPPPVTSPPVPVIP